MHSNNDNPEEPQQQEEHQEEQPPPQEIEQEDFLMTTVRSSSTSERTLDGSLSIYETNIPRVTCALLASITTGGVSYAFGLYGNALKKTLHLSQAQLETISSATFCAGLLSWIPGLIVDRFGTRAGISIGGITGASALLLYWVVAKQYVVMHVNMAVLVLSTLSMAIFLSCALITGSVFKLISCSCEPRNKGSAVGLAKGYVGLGAGAYACLFQAIRTPSTSDLDFLPLCAIMFLFAAAIPSFLILPSRNTERRKVPDVLTPLHFRLLFGSIAMLAILIVGTSLLELSRTGVAHKTTNYPLAILVLAVWLAPLAAQIHLPQRSNEGPDIELIQEEEHDALLQDAGHDDETTIRSDNRQQPVRELQFKENTEQTIPRDLEPPRDPLEPLVERRLRHHRSTMDGHRTLLEMLQTYPAWLLLWTTTILVGGGIVETNNLGQMVESLHFDPVVTPASLSFFSVAQSAGRVATGALSDWALTYPTSRCCIDHGVPRPFFLLIGSLTAVVAHMILAISTEQIPFVIGIALSGLAFGSAWPLMVLIVGEIYGTAHVAANYMFYDGFASAAGTYFLSKLLAQEVYVSHIDHLHSDVDDGATCYGRQCFQLTHVVITFLSLTAVVTSLLFQYATRERYN